MATDIRSARAPAGGAVSVGLRRRGQSPGELGLIWFGVGGALWLSSLAVVGPLRYAVWAVALAADALGGLRMLSAKLQVPLNAWHLTERFRLFVLIVLGESVLRLISAAASRPWSMSLAVVLMAAVVTLAALWWAWNRSADRQALDDARGDRPVRRDEPADSGGHRRRQRGLHTAILAADGATTIAIGPRAALYGGVSVCLLATAILPSAEITESARVARLATSAAAMGLVFMGAIVVPVYLVPALTLVLALCLDAESRPALWSVPRRLAGRAARQLAALTPASSGRGAFSGRSGCGPCARTSGMRYQR